MVSRYVNGPVKQDGICLLPAPPSHYRMMQPQRTDAYHIAGPQQFVQQQPPNQAGNQAPGLRGMAPTGPPTQASTPPNTELKVQHGPQPTMNLSFGPQRGQNYFQRPPPPNQTRMVNQRQSNMATAEEGSPFEMLYQNQQQQIYSAQTAASQFVIPQLPHLFLPSPYYNSTQRPPTPFIPQNYILPSNQMSAYSPYQAQNHQYYYGQMGIQQRQAPPPAQVQTIQQNMTHAPPPNAPPTQASHPSTAAKSKQRREHAIPIINPDTGKEISNDDTHLPSGESSARQTPQPTPPSKEVQATFAKQVAQAISNDHDEQEQVTPIEHHIEPSPPHPAVYHSATQAVHSSIRNDLVQSSKLQVPTKDFVPANQSNTAKETPVVSAISNAVEVTITGKQKDRESPAKGRKHRENSQREQQQHQHRDASKEAPKEIRTEPEKGIKEEKQKEVIAPQAPSPPKEVKEKETIIRDDQTKKSQKKEKAVVDSNKLQSTHPVVQEVIQPEPVVPVQAPTPPVVQETAKSKQNSQRGKDTPKQGGAGSGNSKQQQQQQTMPVTVPPSQPAKPNNKSNKMKELNLKGATKEGTDMDAFNDNTEAVTNVNNESNDCAITPTVNTSIVIEPTKKEVEVNDVPVAPVKPEVKPIMRNKIDVTDIVKDVPKPFVAPAPVEPKDETDRAAINNDKLVQAKNEVNAKASLDNDDNSERVSLPYKENQWSPFNKDGKKVYDKEFLMALRTVPKSKQKPDNILNEIIAQDDKSRVGDVSRYAMGGGGRTDFTPSFGNYAGKSQSQRGVAPKRGSQQGKIGGGGGSKGGKSGSVIRVSISFKEDVKLHETENAWKPARLNSTGVQSDDDKKTEELYRKVRGVLNKLTPQKFSTLLNQIKTLPIDTSDRLQGVIDLVFEKAVDEPNFSIAYALMCRELALMQVPVTAESKEFVNFRKLLITRCQMEFEKNSNEEGNRNEKLKEIEACNDPEKKKELTIQLEEDDRRIRMKSVGNIRFIGELFKQQMLTVNIMVRCLYNLLENKDEERLECLCKLLTTIGKELETAKKVDLAPIFGMMKDIVDKKNGKVSSRVRFMLQDVIDLRSSSWVPRRQDLNPKTIDQIQKEADNEQLTIQALNSASAPMTPRKDDRNMGPNSDRKRGGRNNNNTNDEGWSMATSRKQNFAFSVQSDKLKVKQPTGDISLGSSSLFEGWIRGSAIKTHNNVAQPPIAAQPNANMFACLEKISDMDNKSMGSRPLSKDPYSSKGPSLERSYKQYDGRNSRSGSQHRSNENSQRSTPTPVQQMPVFKPQPPVPVEQTQIVLTPDQLERRIKNIAEEYLNESTNINETKNEIEACLPRTALQQFVFEIYNHVLDRTKTARLNTGKLMAELIIRQTVSLETYCTALEKVFALSDELIVDIPNIWDYYAELIAALVNEKVLSLKDLHKCCEFLISLGYARNLLVSLFKIVIQDKGPNFLFSIWKSSNLSFQDFMHAKQVDAFIADNNLQFLVGSNVTTIGQSNLTYPQISDKLLYFIKTNTSFDDITKWITANLGDRMKEKQFIRVLVTVLIESSIVNFVKLDVEKLRDFYSFFQRYIDNNPDYELQCLYAIQSIVNTLDHPQGLLLKIFNTLYEDNIISHDSFITWEKSDDPAEKEKKGVAVKQLTSFFTQMMENDEESASSGSEET